MGRFALVDEKTTKISAIRLKLKHFLALLCIIGVSGCGIAAQSIRTQPPGNVNRVNPDLDFRELSENDRERKVGSVIIAVVLTMRAGNQRILAGHPVAIVPYSEGFYNDWNKGDGSNYCWVPALEDRAVRFFFFSQKNSLRISLLTGCYGIYH